MYDKMFRDGYNMPDNGCAGDLRLTVVGETRSHTKNEYEPSLQMQYDCVVQPQAK